MSPFDHLLECIGRAVLAKAGDALANGAPLDAAVYAVAEDALRRLRERCSDDEVLAALKALIEASPDQVRERADEVVRLIGDGRTAGERLDVYLTRVPVRLRNALRRPGDPHGATLPLSFRIRSPEDLVTLLPARPPRFRPGDRPPGVGDWELVELLGAGGFGEVWKARHAVFEGITPVALKFCLDPQSKDRLLRHEAAVISQVLRRGLIPGVVPLLDAYLNADPPCLKYEYIDGGDLGALVHDWHRLPGGVKPGHATRVVHRLAQIVGRAHRLDPPVVHRDLKPSNILVQRLGGGKFTLWVADFGIGGVAARHAIDESQTGANASFMAEAMRGAHTPLYASPEQVRGEAPAPTDDIHALGVIWYQLLTADLRNGAPTGRRWEQPLLDRGLSKPALDLLAACVEARAEDRPADAAVLADELARVIANGAADTTPVSGEPTVRGPRGGSLHLTLVLRGHEGSVNGVAFSPDGRRLASASNDRTVRVWDVAAGRTLTVCTGHNTGLMAVAFGPEGRTLAGAGLDGSVTVWDAREGEELQTLRGHTNSATSLAFDPRGGRLASAGWDRTLRVWDLKAGKEALSLRGHRGAVRCVAFSPDGKRLASGGEDQAVVVWNAQTGHALQTLEYHSGPVRDVTFSPDGQWIASAGEDGVINVWDAKNLRRLLTLKGHDLPVYRVVFTFDSQRLISASEDWTVRLWGARSGEPLYTLEGLDGAICSTAVSPDDQRLASGHRDKVIKVWTLG